ncbi:hypothetical protein [Clostridium sp. ZS2-4]|uniref:hypothetical protein n=1 Tax=Clostridium sp. ZS2-4 TaxID=2987703 RepID=UPI00227C2D5D|nr:hypothetical protein [Clostridium sp. ZS2-4]MCY6354740.1 hypothetical protein [Clostridium sp. ZS2-4]
MAAGRRESFVGAFSGAIFGPFGVGEALGGKMLLGGITNGFESILRQKLEGKGINFKTVLTDFGIGAGTAAAFHGAEKLIKKAAPFVKKAFNKISAEISENIRIAKIALNNMKKGPKPAVLGSNLGNGYEALGRLKKEFEKVKNGIGSSVDDTAEVITEGAGRLNNVNSGARYGERKISDELYNKLRKQTPTDEIRDMVNEGVDLPMEDFALPGKQITNALEADHIVPMKKIVCMEGFEKLSYEQQVNILNYKENFIGLSKVANTSKGSKTYEEWLLYKKGNIKVNPEFRERMIRIEKELQGQIQSLIDDFLKK